MKYIIEFEDEPYVNDCGIMLYKCKQSPHCIFNKVHIDNLTPYPEPDREQIENEVWEFARMVRRMNISDWIECFEQNTLAGIFDLDYSEAKAKYESWKAEREQIRVGDEVEYSGLDGIYRFVVLAISGDMAYGFRYPCEDDGFNEYCEIAFLAKTGRTFPEVAELLKKMREE